MKIYRPGDRIEGEIELEHAQYLRDVRVIYKHTEDPRAMSMQLVPDSWEVELQAGGSYASRIELMGGVEKEQVTTPGIYRLAEISMETASDRSIRLSIDDELRSRLPPDTQEFRIIEEPREPPRISTLRIT